MAREDIIYKIKQKKEKKKPHKSARLHQIYLITFPHKTVCVMMTFETFFNPALFT